MIKIIIEISLELSLYNYRDVVVDVIVLKVFKIVYVLIHVSQFQLLVAWQTKYSPDPLD